MSGELFSLDVELAGDEAPTEFRILGAGTNATRKGELMFDEAAAASVLADYEAGGVDLPLDYDHAMADPSARPSDRIAAGWFRPEVRDGELWAADVKWTPRGKAAVEAKEYRYTSLWGDVELTDKKAKRMRLVRLRNVALTNTPATIATLPLVASEKDTGERPMNEKIFGLLEVADESSAVEKINLQFATLSDASEVLGVSVDAIGAAVRALKLRAEAGDAAVLELSELRAKAEASAKDALIYRLSEEGRLPPALHDWARSQTIASLETFGSHAPIVVEHNVAPVAPASGARVELTEEEKAVAKALGLRLSDLANHKKAIAAEEI